MPWATIGHVGLLVLLDIGLLFSLIAIPVGLSGNFIMLGIALLIALLSGFQAIGWVALLLIAAGVAVGEILESLLGSMMARRYGASKWGMLGAYLGGIVGAILGTPLAPITGTILGSFVGAAGCAILFEWIHLRHLRRSMPPGWGAILGKLAASLLKVLIGVATVAYIHVATVRHLFP